MLRWPGSLLFWSFVLISSLILFPISVLLWLVTLPFDGRKWVLHRFTSFWACLYTWLNPAWRVHIEVHLPAYMDGGPQAVQRAYPNCYYCDQLVTWEPYTFRRAGLHWLATHECPKPKPREPGGPGPQQAEQDEGQDRRQGRWHDHQSLRDVPAEQVRPSTQQMPSVPRWNTGDPRSSTRKDSTMKIKTKVKAGGMNLNRSETFLRSK